MYNNAIISSIDGTLVDDTQITVVSDWAESTQDFAADRVLICFNITPASHPELVFFLKDKNIVLYSANSNPVTGEKYSHFPHEYSWETSYKNTYLLKYYFFSTLINKGYDYLTYIPNICKYRFAHHPSEIIEVSRYLDIYAYTGKVCHLSKNVFGTLIETVDYNLYDAVVGNCYVMCSIFKETYLQSIYKPIDISDYSFDRELHRSNTEFCRELPKFKA